MWAFKLIFIVAFLAYKVSALVNPEEVFAWKELTLTWPSDAARDAAIKNGDYVPENNLPLGLGRWKNKMFVTIPRWKTGVPTSLGYVPVDQTVNKTASIIPYPDWETNALPKGNVTSEGIVSVFRLAVDACDRLWIIDSGINDFLEAIKVISPPTILIYDLQTDKLIKRYIFPPEVQKQDSFFAHILEGFKGENTQTTMSVFDEKTNSVFFSQIHRDGVACWNSKRELLPENFVLFAHDSQRLVYVNDMMIDADRNLWIFSDKLAQFRYQGLDPNEINYRILKVKVDDAIAGTPCVA